MKNGKNENLWSFGLLLCQLELYFISFAISTKYYLFFSFMVAKGMVCKIHDVFYWKAPTWYIVIMP